MKNTVKIFLFASLAAALVIPLLMVDSTDAKTNEKSVKDILKDADWEAKQYLKQEQKDKSKDDKKEELKAKYDDALGKALEKIENDAGYELNDDQASEFNDYVVNEILKRAEIEQAYLQDDVIIISKP